MSGDGLLPVFDVLLQAPAAAAPRGTVALPFADRQRSRLRVHLGDGAAAGIKLPRGTLLRDGQWLASSATAGVLQVRAAPEPCSRINSDDPGSLARAAYHLGNRHVWVQVGATWLRYLADPVLDQMLSQLGFSVVAEMAPFEPEAGAYSTEHAHSHAHATTQPSGHTHGA